MTRIDRLASAALIAAIAVGAGAASAKPQSRDAKVWAAAEAARPAQLELWKSVVNIDSGTGDVDGGRRVEALLIPQLKALGASIETVPAEAPDLPDNVVATVTGKGHGRVLMIGHIDTVFGPGTVAKWPFQVQGDRLTGPGVGDEKGGVIEAITALEILRKLGFHDFGRITLLIETSEEKGSPGTRKLIDRLVRENDVELNLEPGDPPDGLTVWRKASMDFRIAVKGRAAHAGVAPEKGRNAAVELIHQLQGIEALPHVGDQTTANITIIQAGARSNIIPEDAYADVNVRVRDMKAADEVDAVLQRNAQTHVVPDTSVTVTHGVSFPPLQDNAATEALATRARAIYAGIDRKIENAGNGGASESAMAAAAGTPALDGLGPVGGNFHSDKEYVDLTTVTPRLYLLTKLLMDLGAHPPAKGR